jgi:hypothetical protein
MHHHTACLLLWYPSPMFRADWEAAAWLIVPLATDGPQRRAVGGDMQVDRQGGDG